jgi:hypothetical protein
VGAGYATSRFTSLEGTVDAAGRSCLEEPIGRGATPLAGYNGAVSSRATPSGSLNGRTTMEGLKELAGTRELLSMGDSNLISRGNIQAMTTPRKV